MSISVKDSNGNFYKTASTPIVDSSLSSSSKNAIMNRAVYAALQSKVEASVSNLVNYYLKSETYSKDEVDALVGEVSTLSIKVVAELPTTEISTSTLYFVGPETGTTNYTQYIYSDSTWVSLGSTAVDLSSYVTDSELTLVISDFVTEAGVQAMIADYYTKTEVDALVGNMKVGDLKDVSVNSPVNGQYMKYDSLLKKWTNGSANISIASLEDIGDVNLTNMQNGDRIKWDSDNSVWVNGPGAKSNWNEDDSSSDAYIMNKPTLGTAASKDIPSSGNAGTTEVVLGNDTRLTNDRNAADVYSWAKESTKPSYDADEIPYDGTTSGLTADDVQEAIDELASEKADAATTIAGYGITDAYTKTEVNNKISELETNITWKAAVATYSDIATTYPNPQPGWTVVANDVNIAYRYTTADGWVAISANATPEATTEVDGLMTTTQVIKLNGIEAGAKVNVQSDWNQTTTTADDYIKNKPTTVAGYGITDVYTKTEVESKDSTVLKVVGRNGAKNLIPFDLDTIKKKNIQMYPDAIWEDNVFTTNGVSFTVNDDGTVIANGTPTGSASIHMYDCTGNESFIGERVILSGCPSGGSGSTYKVMAYRMGAQDGSTGTLECYGNEVNATWVNNGSGTKAFVSISVYTGAGEVTNLEFKPMLRLYDDSDTTYQPYAKTNKELTDEVDYTRNSVASNTSFNGSKNILAFTHSGYASGNATYVLNDDKSITVTTTNTSGDKIYYLLKAAGGTPTNPETARNLLHVLKSCESGTYVLTGRNGNAQVILDYYTASKTWISAQKAPSSGGAVEISVPNNAEYVQLYIKVASGSAFDGTVYPMICLKSDYELDSSYAPPAKTNGWLTEDTVDWDDYSWSGSINAFELTAKSYVDETAGVTYTVNDDKTITVSASNDTYPYTVPADTYLTLRTFTGKEPFVGKRVKVTGCPSGGTENTFYLSVYRAGKVDGSGWSYKEFGDGVIVPWLNNGSGTKAAIFINVKANTVLESAITFETMIAPATYNGSYVPFTKANSMLTDNVKSLTNHISNYESKNLIQYYDNEYFGRSLSKHRFNLQPDGSITVTNTAATTSLAAFKIGKVSLKADIQYVLSGGISGDARLDLRNTFNTNIWSDNKESKEVISTGGTSTFTPNEDVTLDVYIRISSGKQITGTFYPMLCERFIYDINSEFIGGSLSNRELTIEKMDWVSNGVIGAKNLLTIPTGTQQFRGVEYVVNDDYSITINRNAAYSGISYFNSQDYNNRDGYHFTLGPGNYIFSIGHDTRPAGTNLFFLNNKGTGNAVVYCAGGDAWFNLQEETTLLFSMSVNSDSSPSNVTIYPMVRIAEDTDTTYRPPSYTNTLLTSIVKSMFGGGLTSKFIAKNVSKHIYWTSDTSPDHYANLDKQYRTDIVQSVYDLFSKLGGKSDTLYTGIMYSYANKKSDGSQLGSGSGFYVFFAPIGYTASLNKNSDARMSLLYHPYGAGQITVIGIWGTNLRYCRLGFVDSSDLTKLGEITYGSYDTISTYLG